MSAFDTDEGKREIIIVKRGGGDHEDGHHGGVWKIAFADFMTAMMCFFLVMWLISATNEQTKAAIASYFNPMTLVDAAPSQKGLDDPGEAVPSEKAPDSGAERTSQEETDSGASQFYRSADHDDTRKTSDQHLFADPYAVLAEIAAQTSTLQNVSDKGDGGAQTSGPATGAQGGESYRDPFAPDFWSQEVAGAEDDSELNVFRQPQRQDEAVEETAEEGTAEDASPAAGRKQAAAAETEEADAETAEEGAVSARTQQIAEAIRAEIAEAFGRDSELNRAVSVTTRLDGVLISVTDELNFGMFEVGSAVPRGELVLAMEKISRTLNEHTGRIRINGHTDARPFRNANYDNWRLSTARAHSAYYMLVRAGLDETRVKEVAGFADRELKVADDPFADANRRIEIFLETGG